MEFTQYTCPVCEKRFVNGDDVVVCPECGAPHHRECYEQNGRCFYEDKHAEGFNFEKSEAENASADSDNQDVIICPNCKTENSKIDFYCRNCGYPLDEKDRTQSANANQNQNQQYQQQGMPFGFGSAGMPTFDPMAGIGNDEEVAQNVTAGEAAKYVGKNTAYYLPIFKYLKNAKNARFSFSAFLFTGGFLLKRKMYTLGIIIMLLMIGLTVGSACVLLSNKWILEGSSFDLVKQVYAGDVSSEKYIAITLYSVIEFAKVVVRVLSGIFANKLYYRHCAKVIQDTKTNEAPSDVNKVLEEKGGVNLAMGVSFFSAYLIIYELCRIYLAFTL